MLQRCYVVSFEATNCFWEAAQRRFQLYICALTHKVITTSKALTRSCRCSAVCGKSCFAK